MAKKLYIGNLPFSVDDGKLREIFSAYGDVEEATVITDKFSKRSKGFGFVTFTNDGDADKAISEMNEKEVDGRNIKVNEAKPMEERPPRRDFGNRSFGNRDRPRRY
jgi:RNA recognition motif-containing protein